MPAGECGAWATPDVSTAFCIARSPACELLTAWLHILAHTRTKREIVANGRAEEHPRLRKPDYPGISPRLLPPIRQGRGACSSHSNATPLIPKTNLIVTQFQLSFANSASLTVHCRADLAYKQLARGARLACDASLTTHLPRNFIYR